VGALNFDFHGVEAVTSCAKGTPAARFAKEARHLQRAPKFRECRAGLRFQPTVIRATGVYRNRHSADYFDAKWNGESYCGSRSMFSYSICQPGGSRAQTQFELGGGCYAVISRGGCGWREVAVKRRDVAAQSVTGSTWRLTHEG
jgi:hypothetical protein